MTSNGPSSPATCSGVDAPTTLPMCSNGVGGRIIRRVIPYFAGIALGSLGCGALGCGGAEPVPAEQPSQPTPARAAPTPHRNKPGLQVAGELGSRDLGKVEDTFSKLGPGLGECMAAASQKIEFISGHVRFLVRIAKDGSTRWVYLADSTVGDRETEKCMLDKVRSTRWPPPAEGEGQADKSFDFDRGSPRDAVAWEPDRVSKPLRGARNKLVHCVQGAQGKYKATAYVATNGTVMAVGVAPPDEHGEANVDCLADVIRTLKLPEPGGWPAKVTFEVP